MSSAVPYEPDDFDNNPFSEQGVIPPASNLVQSSSSQSPLEHSERDNSTGDIRSNDSQNKTQSDLDKVANKLFRDFPNEQDLKKYIPERLNRKSFNICVKIQEVEKNGNITYKNPVLRFNASVKNIPGFRRSLYRDVRRTYKEIQGLYKYLIFNNIEVFVPALPSITIAYKAMSPEFLSTVSRSTQEWFDRVCSNPILIRNQEFILFFEQNDFSYTPSKTKPSSNSVMATGIRRKTLKQLQPPYDACEELAEYRPMIKSIHIESEKLTSKMDDILRLEKQLCVLDSDFYSDISKLSPLNDDKQIGKVWNKFNKVMQVFTEMNLVSVVGFDSAISNTFKLISDDCYNIKESLTNRHLLMRELINAEEITKKKHGVITRLKSKSIIDPIKIDEAIRSLEMANNYEKEIRYEVKRTTYEMLIESRDYTEYFTQTLKRLLKSLAKQQIRQERKKLHLLTSNRIINPKESLGRLGRESYPEGTAKSSQDFLSDDSWTSRSRKIADSPIQNSNGSKNRSRAGLDELSNVDAKNAASLLASSSF